MVTLRSAWTAISPERPEVCRSIGRSCDAEHYELRKTLRAASGDTITVEFTETFVRPKTGEPMQGFGGEFWTMDGDRLAEWHLYWRGCPRNDASPA